MTTEIIIYAYMILCLCMLFYNIIFIFYNKAYKNISKKGIAKWKRNILENPSNQSKKLEKKLSHLKQLALFDEALESIRKEDKGVALEYLHKNREVFYYLIKVYEQKESMKKAYYAYMLSSYSFSESDFDKKVARALVNYATDSSVYCRENTLKALYSIGNIESLVEAYRIMNRSGINHNEKLVADGLLSFKGDKALLAKSLWRNYKEFDIAYQVSFVNFINRVTDEFCEEFFVLLKDSNINIEVKYAMLRYFRRYYYEPMKEYLYNCIIFQEEMNWEFVAIVASVLDNYPCDKTMQILKTALYASNWYIRYNAADSLLRLGATYLELQNIYDGTDRYAREMIEYKMQENNIKA